MGTGCVKITPAHDPNDYEVGLRQNLPMINILNLDGTLNDNAGPLSRADRAAGPRAGRRPTCKKLGLLENVEDRVIDLAHSDRSKTPIEPLLTDQWFVKHGTAGPDGHGRRDRRPGENHSRAATPRAISIGWARSATGPSAGSFGGDTRFPSGTARRPARTTCSGPSPAATTWSGSATSNTASGSSAPRKTTCPKTPCPATRSSASRTCWTPGSARPSGRTRRLGWPEQTPELAYYYPTNVLITSRDIITLWVARMVLTGLYNVGEVPFHDVYIHPKILDAYGEGMSKSKGNGVDPLDVIEKFGADSLRFGLAYLTTETQDIRMPVDFECPHCGRSSSRRRRTASCRGSSASSAARSSPRNGPRSRPTRPCRGGPW